MKKILLALLLVLTLGACDSEEESNIDYPVEYYNATVTETVVDGDDYTMTIESTGFSESDMIKSEVTVTNGEITAFEILEHAESSGYGEDIIEEGTLIDEIIANSSDLDSVDVKELSKIDANTGATVTGNALMDTALGALEHFETYYE